MADLAIKGHPTRGKEVIQLLEMLGGVNKHQIGAIRQTYVYFIDIDNIIRLLQINQLLPEKDIVYSLEEFEEKYPYKVGDRVTYRTDKLLETQVITNMRWDSNYNCVLYYLDNCNVIKVEDILYIIESPEDNIPTIQDKTTIETMKEDKDMSEHTTEINLNHPCFDGQDKIELIIPENWKFEQRGDKMFGIRKYPQYPKTYEECCVVLGLEDDETEIAVMGWSSDEAPVEKFMQLLRCRDAYWKIAGEQMGLGKPWEPDWDNLSTNHEFIKINKGCFTYSSRVLVFPTEEMRDEFYKNFKDLIERCKKLL